MAGIAFFDFDGTITTKDTLFGIIRYQKGPAVLYAGMALLSPVLVMFKLKMLSNQRMKEIVLGLFFKGNSREKFQELSREYCIQELPKSIRPGAITAILDHTAAGRRVVVVSASAEDWVKPWCDGMGIECIGSRLQVENNRITGKLVGLNCNGDEKVRRIKEQITLSNYDTIYAYGDTSGDKPMLALAGGNGFFKPFRG